MSLLTKMSLGDNRRYITYRPLCVVFSTQSIASLIDDFVDACSGAGISLTDFSLFDEYPGAVAFIEGKALGRPWAATAFCI